MSNLLRSSDYDADFTRKLFAAAARLKAMTAARQYVGWLQGRTVAMIFQKPSLRTRTTFDVGVHQLGGHAVYLGPSEISMGVRESVYDVAKNLERWVDLIVARVFDQNHIDELARHARIPVINALSDDEHPCQALADYFTLYERGVDLTQFKLAYVGDGNNVCTSLMTVAATLGGEFRVAAPAGYAPAAVHVERCRGLAEKNGARLLIVEDPLEAVAGADAVYTDVWASMGQEAESVQRARDFANYQVNAALMAHAAPGALVMHDLPAHRGEEITSEVMDGPTSVVFDQAENRLHIQKVIMLACLGLLEPNLAE